MMKTVKFSTNYEQNEFEKEGLIVTVQATKNQVHPKVGHQQK